MSLTGPETARFDTAARRRTVMSGNALGVASMFAWACGFPAAEILLESWPPLALITARFALAVGMLVSFWALREGPMAVLRARWGRGVLVGGFTFGLGAYLLLVAQSLTDAVTVAIIASATPVAGALVEVMEKTRRLSRMFVLGLVASVVGGIVATGGNTGGQFGLGAMAVIASSFLFVFGSQFTAKGLSDLSEVGRSTITLGGGMVFTSVALLVSNLIGLDVLPRAAVDSQQFALLAIYAIAGMALSQVMWIASVGRLGVAVASFHINVAPFYVMLLMMALGDGWSWQKATGAAIVIVGVVIAQRPDRRRAHAA